MDPLIYIISVLCLQKKGLTISSRLYSTKINKYINLPSDSTKSIIFSDADRDKLAILETKGRSGIYMWTSKLNGKKYLGSSVNLRRRLLEYYNVNRLLKESSMPINVALLKYGYHNFSLTILEFCDIDSLMAIEKYYFEVYSPEYNILQDPGSPSRGSGWKHSEGSIDNMRIAASKRSKSLDILAKLSAAQFNSIGVEVTDLETNAITTYHAIRAAARALGLDKRYIEHYIYLNQEKPVLGRYTFKLLNPKSLSLDLDIKVQKTSQKLEVINVETNEITLYPSISATARALGYHQASLSLYLKDNRTKPFKGKYLFKLV